MQLEKRQNQQKYFEVILLQKKAQYFFYPFDSD
jgi:hypothetical protein